MAANQDSISTEPDFMREIDLYLFSKLQELEGYTLYRVIGLIAHEEDIEIVNEELCFAVDKLKMSTKALIWKCCTSMGT